MPLVTVSFPSILREQLGCQPAVTVEGATVRDIIAALDRHIPGMRFHLCYETGELRPFVNIYLQRVNIRALQGLDTPIPPDAQMRILPSVAGG
jgi:molybdopterin synthase sulfur carrier subunit